MSLLTSIQWCDSTENPVMGCDGCPLFPTVPRVRATLVGFLERHGVSSDQARTLVQAATGSLTLTDLYQQRAAISDQLGDRLAWDNRRRRLLEQVIASQVHCYAAMLHLRWADNRTKPGKKRNPGLARFFEEVTCFPGRMQKAAAWPCLLGTARPEKPWLDGLPRLIFVSDMGDALSSAVSFDYLHQEIVQTALSPTGRRHVWLWLTKRPARLARFGGWLRQRGVDWPANLVAMTSVLNQRMARSAVDWLRKVPAPLRGLSVEPLLEPVAMDLRGIDWVIVGGESGHYARPFQLEWARQLQVQCRDQSIAFFVKQLGAHPCQDGAEIKLHDRHGGDWNEWPRDLRVREVPKKFRLTVSRS